MALAALAALAAALLPCAAYASSGPSDRVAPVALGLAVILIAAKVGGHLAVRVGQVAVLGELLAGVALGNLPGAESLRWLREDPSIDVLARLGALILLFEVGLELSIREVSSVGRSAVPVAVLGTLGSLLCGGLASFAMRPDAGAYAHAFTGAALTATSVGITARVVKDLGRTKTPESRIILGAAVIDDVIGLVILTLVTGAISAAGALGAISFGTVGWTVGKAAAFFVVAFVVGSRAAPIVFAAAARLRSSGALVAVGLALCFLFAWCADALGLAPIVGAFMAGLVVEDAHSARFVARGERSLRDLIEPVSSFLVPVFFVLMGARVDVHVLAAGAALGMAAALTLAAIVGKLACAAGAAGVRRLPTAVGMMPRGEVTLIYASMGGSLLVGGKPVLDPALYSALVFVVLATTLLTPALLRWTFVRSEASTVPEASRAP